MLQFTSEEQARLQAYREAMNSILAYNKERRENGRQRGSSFRKAVERDAVRVVTCL